MLSVSNYNEGIENEFLKRLIQEMGDQAISNIKGMIQDIVNSKKVNADFNHYMVQRRDKYPTIRYEAFNVYLLTQGKWPAEILEGDSCTLPADLEVYTKCFLDHFETVNLQGTKAITWILEEGFVEVTGSFGKSKKILTLTVPQYAVIYHLSKAPQMKLTLGDLKDKLGMKKILATVAPLVNKKLVLREKTDLKEKVEDTEYLSINSTFEHKLRDINCVTRKTLKNRSSEGDNQKIDEGRKAMIESAIVKNMKSKKVSKFNELAGEVRKILQDHFQPPDKLLREMIEDLMRRDFLERDENDINIIKYRA